MEMSLKQKRTTKLLAFGPPVLFFGTETVNRSLFINILAGYSSDMTLKILFLCICLTCNILFSPWFSVPTYAGRLSFSL